jgi:hypothetical protein
MLESLFEPGDRSVTEAKFLFERSLEQGRATAMSSIGNKACAVHYRRNR